MELSELKAKVLEIFEITEVKGLGAKRVECIVAALEKELG